MHFSAKTEQDVIRIALVRREQQPIPAISIANGHPVAEGRKYDPQIRLVKALVKVPILQYC
jgi:hypothetical protein